MGIPTSTIIIVGASFLLTIIIVVIVMRKVSPVVKSAKYMMQGMTEMNQIRTSGNPGQATVLKVQATGTMINNMPLVGLTLKVHGTTGSPYEVQLQTPLPQIHIPRVQPNSTIPVKIDPNDPNKIALDL